MINVLKKIATNYGTELLAAYPVEGRDEVYRLDCNPGSGLTVWTPTRLKLAFGPICLTHLLAVSINVDTANLQPEVIDAVDEWIYAGIPVQLRFPELANLPDVGNAYSPTCFGLDAEDCYQRNGMNKWETTTEFKSMVAKIFMDDALVTLH